MRARSPQADSRLNAYAAGSTQSLRVLGLAGDDDGVLHIRSLDGAGDSDGGGMEAQPASAAKHASKMVAASMNAMAPDRGQLRDLGIAGLTSRDGDALRGARGSGRDRALNLPG